MFCSMVAASDFRTGIEKNDRRSMFIKFEEVRDVITVDRFLFFGPSMQLVISVSIGKRRMVAKKKHLLFGAMMVRVEEGAAKKTGKLLLLHNMTYTFIMVLLFCTYISFFLL